jgi:excinuclease UvrABC nuclease subunit
MLRSEVVIREKVSLAVRNLVLLMESESKPFSRRPLEGSASGIYALFEHNEPVYVGRTRNLKQRFAAHITPNHNSASFAIKRLRRKFPEIARATYQKTGSREWIAENYRDELIAEINAIKSMQYKFVNLEDSIDQYFLEFLAEEEFGLDHDGLNTS